MTNQIEKYYNFLQVGMTVHYVDAWNSVSAKITEKFEGGLEVETSDFYFKSNSKKEYLFLGEIQRGWKLSEKTVQEIEYLLK